MSFDDIIAKYGGSTKKNYSGTSGAISKAADSVATAAKDVITGKTQVKKSFDDIVEKYGGTIQKSTVNNSAAGSAVKSAAENVASGVKKAMSGEGSMSWGNYTKSNPTMQSDTDVAKWYEASSHLFNLAYDYWENTGNPYTATSEMQEIYNTASRLKSGATETDTLGGGLGFTVNKTEGEQEKYLKSKGYSSMAALEKAMEEAAAATAYNTGYGSDYTEKLLAAAESGNKAIEYMKAHPLQYSSDAIHEMSQYVSALETLSESFTAVQDYYGQYKDAEEFKNGLGRWRSFVKTMSSAGNEMGGGFTQAAAQLTANEEDRYGTTVGEDAIIRDQYGGDRAAYLRARGEQKLSEASEIEKKAAALFEKGAAAKELAKWRKSGLQKVGIDIGSQIPAFASDALVTAAGSTVGLGHLGLVTMAARAYGQGSYQARQAGLDWDKANVAGIKTAAIEVGTELIFGAGSKIAYGKGITDKTVEAAITKAVTKASSNKNVQKLLKLMAASGEEGLEEMLSDIFNPIADRILKLKDEDGQYLDDFDLEEMFYDGLVGAALGVVGGGAGNVITTAQKASAYKTAYEGHEQELVDEAKKAAEGSELYKLGSKYQSILDSGEKLSGRELTRLSEALGDSERSKATETVKKRLTELGETENVDAITEAIIARVYGEGTTRKQGKSISNSEYGLQTLFELSLGLIGTETQQTENVKGNDTEEVQPDIIIENDTAETVEQPAEADMGLGAMTVEEMGDYLTERYAEAVKNGTLSESMLKTMTQQVGKGVPLEDIINRADAYIQKEQGFKDMEAQVRAHYAEEIKAGIVDEASVASFIKTVRDGAPYEETLAQFDEIVNAAKEMTAGKEQKNGTESVRGGVGRQSDVGSRVESRGVSEGTGRDKGTERGTDRGGQDNGQPHNKGTPKAKVSSKELGIKGGTDTKRNTVVEASPRVKAIAEAAKVKITTVTDTMEVGGKTVNGAALDNENIIVQANNRLYSAEQIALHEITHIYMDADMFSAMRQEFLNELGEREYEELANRYYQIWKGLYKLPEGVKSENELGEYFDNNPDAYEEFLNLYAEELFCDAVAGINRQSAPGAGRFRDAARKVFKEQTGIDLDAIMLGAPNTQAKAGKSQTESKANAARGPPRVSAEEDITDTEKFKSWFGDWKNDSANASKVVNPDGTPKVVYHQTGNNFTVFETRREGAGARDDGTPFGIFLKSSSRDIGLAGKKQMALYAKIVNPLRVKNREELKKAIFDMSSEYRRIVEEHEGLDREYNAKTKEAKNNLVKFIADWRKENPDASRTALYDVREFNRIFDEEDIIIEEWTEKADVLSIAAKEAMVTALENNGYDGIFLEKDEGSFGRSTDAYIALYPEQVKSATDNVGTFNPNNPDIRFSPEEADAEYLAAIEAGDMVKAQELVDEAARAAGYTERLYHGTPNGTFSVFRDWTYFTTDESYADIYQKQGASVNFKKTANNPKTYGVYAKYENPFDTRKTRDKRIFNNEFYRKWGNGAPLSERGLPDWTDGDDLIEFFDENGYDYDAMLLDEGGTGGYGEAVKDRGISYVIKEAAQIKSADPVTYDDNGEVIPLSERFNPENEDIRFSPEETEQESTRVIKVRERAKYMGVKALRERLAVIDGQIKGFEDTADRTPAMDTVLTQLRADRDIFDEALKNKQKKAEEKKADRKKSKTAAEAAAKQLPIRSSTKLSRKQLKDKLYDIYGIKSGITDMSNTIDLFLDTWMQQGKISLKAVDKLENILLDMGEIRTEPFNDSAREFRSYIAGTKIYVPKEVASEFSDDWDSFRRRAFGNKIYLTTDKSSGANSIDGHASELKEAFGSRFDVAEYDEKTVLENIVELAEEGKAENLSLWQLASRYRKFVGKETADALLEDAHNRFMEALRSFSDSAKVEMEAARRSIFRDVRRIEELKRIQERAQERKELSKTQLRLFKLIKRLKGMYNTVSQADKAEIDEIIGGINTITMSAATRLDYIPKYDMVAEDLLAMYDKFKAEDYGMEKKELEMLRERIERKSIRDMDMDEVLGLLNAATALATRIYNKDKVIGDQMHAMFSDIAPEAVQDMHDAIKPKNVTKKIVKKAKKKAGQAFRMMLDSDEALNPIQRIARMFGDKEGSAGYQIFGKGLEKGERDMRRYVEQAIKMLDPWLMEHQEWLRKADGQGKDGIWYEYEVHPLLQQGNGDKPIFDGFEEKESPETVKIYMTPLQKVHLYLESKNDQNIRHMQGGRTFPVKELYEAGAKDEAFDKAIPVKLSKAGVLKLVSDMTPTELELAALLEKFYNTFAKENINRVSNALDGYDRAMSSYYAPIFTNSNYNKADPGVYQDGTAEGVGHMKSRQDYAGNPSYNISALDAFYKHTLQSSAYVGLAIPIRNAKTLLNWYVDGTSMQNHITNEWSGKELENLKNIMAELQGADYMLESEFAEGMNLLMSRYIGGVFGANTTVAAKVLASLPTAAIELGNKYYPSISQQRNVNTELISKYTSELDIRIRGLGTPELAALTLDEGKYQQFVQSNKLTQLTLGGGLLQAADVFVSKVLWPWAENKVRAEYPDLELGTDEQIQNGTSPFYKKVAEVYDTAIGNTQSMYDIMHRSNIMRSKNEITRSFTIFHTDSLQAANLLRMRARQLAAAKKSGDGKRIKAAKKAMAQSIANVALMTIMVCLCNLLRDIWRRRFDKYKNDEGELTFWSALSEIMIDLAENAAGMIIGVDALVTPLLSWLDGEEYYDHEIIALEVFNDIIEGGLNFFSGAKGFIEELADIIKNDGDVWQFLKDEADFRGIVKDTAEAFAHYFVGVPIKNLERFITSALGWFFPQVAAAYDGLWEEASKSKLGQSTNLEASIKQLYETEFSDTEAAELARLYEAGYTNAIISDTPSSFSVDGETYELDEADKQTYNTIVNNNLRHMSAIMDSAEYKAASDEERAAMLGRLYTYAADLAKGKVNPEHELSSFTEQVFDWLDAGMSWAQIASGNTSDNEASKKYIDAGVSWDVAQDIMDALDALEPEYGYTSVTAKQKVREVAYMTISEADKENALKVIYGNSEKAYERYMISRSAGVLTANYADFIDVLDRIDVNGGSPSQAEFKQAVAESGFSTEAAKGIWYTYWKSTSPWG